MIPKSGWTTLSKAIVLVAGPDSTKLLNGLVTSRFLPAITKKNEYTVSATTGANSETPQIDSFNVSSNWGIIHEDIYDEWPSHVWLARNGINSMFLNSKGRVLWDCFIYPTPFSGTDRSGNSEYLIEVDPCFESKLLSYLKMHKLGSKVSIKKMENAVSNYYFNDENSGFDDYVTALDETYGFNYTVSEAWENAAAMQKKLFNPNVIHNGNLLGFAMDNRIPNFGLKFITTSKVEEEKAETGSESAPSPFIFPAAQITESDVALRRYINGLYECGDNPSVSLFPFEYNLDYTNGLSLDKGCYIGQELTIRTFNNQLFRKRIMPGQFYDIVNGPPVELEPAKLTLEIADDSLLPLDDVEAEAEAAAVEAEAATGFQAAANPFGGVSKVVRKRKSSPGKILASRDKLGFALVNIGALDKSHGLFQVKTDQGSMGFKVFTPDWWPRE